MTIIIPQQFQDILMAYRRVAGSYVAGRWVAGAESSFEITGSSQPLIGSELNSQLVLLPAGTRKRVMRKLYTDTLLRTVNPETKIDADQVEIGGLRFEVMIVHDHTANNNSHNKIILAKVNP